MITKKTKAFIKSSLAVLGVISMTVVMMAGCENKKQPNNTKDTGSSSISENSTVTSSENSSVTVDTTVTTTTTATTIGGDFSIHYNDDSDYNVTQAENVTKAPIASNASATACVKSVNGIPRLFVNGVCTEPVFFMPPHYDFEQNESLDNEMKYAAKYGVNMIVIPYGTAYHDTRKFFVSKLKSVLETILSYNPNTQIILRLSMVGTPSDFGLDDSQASYANGKITKEVSMASDSWYEQAKIMLKNIVENVKSDAFLSQHVIGYEYLGGNSGEWFEYDYWDGIMDTSECNRLKFAEYLSEKYTDDAALQAAWNNSSVTLGNAQLPDYSKLPGINNASAQGDNVRNGQFLLTNPENQIYVDYFDYLNSLRAQRLCGFASVIKEASNREKLAITYYGYELETCTASSGHFDMSQLLACPDVDILSGPVTYADRNEGATGAYMSLVNSVTASGKMWVDEGDYRSPVYTIKPDIAFPATTNLMNQVMRRELAKCMAFNTGVWWLDLRGAGWFNYESFWKRAQNMTNLMHNYIAVQQKVTPDICFVVDESAMSLVGSAQTYGASALQSSRYTLLRSGYSVGSYLLEDLIDGRIDDAKVYIISNPWRLSSSQVSAIEQKVHRAGKVALYMYGNGLTSADDFQKLTGMSVHGVTDSSEMEISLNMEEGLSYSLVGDQMSTNPVYYVDDTQGVQTLGTYSKGAVAGKIGMASYSQDGWSSVYFGGTRLNADLLTYIASIAGLKPFSTSQDVLYSSDKMITLHASSAGDKTVNFPSDCDIFNIENGKWYHGDSITLSNVQIGQTVVLLYGNKDELRKIVG